MKHRSMSAVFGALFLLPFAIAHAQPKKPAPAPGAQAPGSAPTAAKPPAKGAAKQVAPTNVAYVENPRALLFDLPEAPAGDAAKCFTPDNGKYKLEKLLPGCPMPPLANDITLQGTSLERGGKPLQVSFVVLQGADGALEWKEPRELPQVVETKAGALATGPIPIVLADKTVLFADKITMSGETGTQPEPQTYSECAWWKIAHGDRKSQYVHIDLAHGGSVIHGPARSVVTQRDGVIVLVCHRPTQEVSVEMGGTRGLSSPAANNQRGAISAQGEAGGKGPIEPAITVFRFAPRQPGSADITVYEGRSNPKKLLVKTELEVDKLYWGAIRLGVGTVFGEWRSYEIVSFAGSRQQEVREVPSTAAFELVSGFAPYLVDYLAWGGRSHTGGKNFFAAPYFGFGVLGAQASSGTLEALSSIHAGLEFEFASEFSIATTFVMRRTQVLADGYQRGSPIGPGMTVDGITESDFRPGFGVVLNASPSFLQFATGTSDAAKNASIKNDTPPPKENTEQPAQPAPGGGS